MRYLRQKLLFYVVAVWAALTLNFLIPRMVKGDPVEAFLARTQNSTPMPVSARHALELQFGITRDPLWLQYWHYLVNLVHGQLGVSLTYYPAPVTQVLRQALPWTVIMVGTATMISVLLGLTLGMLAGWRRGTWLDGLIPATTFLAAIPYFWLALVLLYVFGSLLHWFPLNLGYSYDTTIGWNSAFIASGVYHAILPAA